MQLQQLRYLIAAAECGSFRAAAGKLFVSQSSISTAVKDLEQEMGVQIFTRLAVGIEPTADGVELISYAQRVVEQADIMAARFSISREELTEFALSSVHNLLVAKAFGDFVELHAREDCDFALRESPMNQIVSDVRDGRSTLGVIYLSNYNDAAVRRVLEHADLSFTSLFIARPVVIVGEGHPLAKLERVKPEQLADFDRYELEQGIENASYYANEPISLVPHRRKIVLGDNSSLAAILAQQDGYSIATGISPANRSLAMVPLDTDEAMNVGFVQRKDAERSLLVREFVTLLCRRILAHEGDIEPSSAVYYYTHTHST